MPSCTARPARSSASRWPTPASTTAPTWPAGSRCSRRCGATGVTRLVYSSTAAVYGEPRRVPIAEADRTQPINPYGETKLAFEGAMRWFCAAHDFRAISLRYFNVAGATERNGEDHDPETHLMPLVLRVAAGEATPRPDPRPGLPDAGRHLHPRLHPRPRPRQRAPAGARGHRRGRCLARGLQPRLGGGLQRARGGRGGAARDRPRHPGPRRSSAGVGDPPVLVASSRRARRELGWQPQHSHARADAGRRVGLARGASRRLRRCRARTAQAPAPGRARSQARRG